MVNAIVGVTLKYSCGNTTTPFEHEALQHGYKYEGGKPDDITAVLTLFKLCVYFKQYSTCPLVTSLPVVIIITEETTSGHIDFLFFFLLFLSGSGSSFSGTSSSDGSSSSSSTYN